MEGPADGVVVNMNRSPLENLAVGLIDRDAAVRRPPREGVALPAAPIATDLVVSVLPKEGRTTVAAIEGYRSTTLSVSYEPDTNEP